MSINQPDPDTVDKDEIWNDEQQARCERNLRYAEEVINLEGSSIELAEQLSRFSARARMIESGLLVGY